MLSDTNSNPFIKDPLFWTPVFLGSIYLPVNILHYEFFSMSYSSWEKIDSIATIAYFIVSALVIASLIFRKDFKRIPRIILGLVIGFILPFIELFLFLGLACKIDVGYCL